VRRIIANKVGSTSPDRRPQLRAYSAKLSRWVGSIWYLITQVSMQMSFMVGYFVNHSRRRPLMFRARSNYERKSPMHANGDADFRQGAKGLAANVRLSRM
jgi:hypothetical protein